MSLYKMRTVSQDVARRCAALELHKSVVAESHLPHTAHTAISEIANLGSSHYTHIVGIGSGSEHFAKRRLGVRLHNLRMLASERTPITLHSLVKFKSFNRLKQIVGLVSCKSLF